MAVKVQAQPIVQPRSPGRALRQVLAPIGQILVFVVGGSVLLGGIVLLLAVLLQGVIAQPNLFNTVFSILPLVIIDGLVLGFLYATIALGYTLVYGVLEFINFAHGEIFMVGAFAAGGLGVFLANRGILASMPSLVFVAIALLIGMTVSGVLAMTIERLAYRPLRNAPRLVPLISAIGVSLVLQDLMRLIVGQQYFNLRLPDAFGLKQRFTLAQVTTPAGTPLPIVIDAKSLLFIGVSLLILVGLNYLVNITKLGKAIRAVAQDRATASLMGINVNLIIALTFLIGGALGGAAGTLFVVRYSINPYSGFLIGLKAFTAAVLGGIGNITGAMVGGIVLGLLEVFVSNYLSLFTANRFSGPDYASVAAFLILVGILIFKPSGLLGEAVVQKV
jgi:branched-chain amino acid transport system permease protein